MHRISCRPVAGLIRAARRRRLRLEALLDGLPIEVETLEDPRATVEWTVLCAFLERLEEECGGPLELIELGRSLNDSSVVGDLWKTVRFALAPRQLYYLTTRWQGPQLFPFSSSTFAADPEGRFLITIEISPAVEGSLPFFRIIQGVYETLPELIGLGRAVIDADLTRRRGVYTVTPPPPRSGLARIARVFALFRSSRSAMEDLAEQYEQLRQSYESRRAGEERFLLLTENASELIAEWNGRGACTWVSPNVQRILGISQEAFRSDPWSLLQPEDRDRLRKRISDRAASGGSGRVDFQLLDAQGRWRWFENTSNVVSRNDGHARIVTVSRDVTDEREARENLRVSEERYRAIAEHAFDVIAELDEEGRFRYLSPSYASALAHGPDGLLGEVAFDYVHPDDVEDVAAKFHRLIETGNPETVGVRMRGPNGSWRDFETIGTRYRTPGGQLRAITINRDVTERRALEEELRQSQKMEALGQLAGGIAHDFNNLLTVVRGYSEQLIAGLGDGSQSLEAAQQVMEAADRAASLTNRLLSFGRRRSARRDALDLNQVVSSMEGMLSRVIGEDVEVRSELSAEPPWVSGDPTRLEQVILNLALNARDAMPRGGRLTVATASVSIEAKKEATPPALPGGRYAKLTVTDTGTGMDEETRSRLFEPFFTTKEAGRGTGLGMSIVSGIVDECGGHIEVASTPGLGSTFTIWLPRIDGRPKATERVALSPGGNETVLVVEDEKNVREVTRLMLEGQGYRVLTARGGEEAQRILGHTDVDLLLSDVVMPLGSGPELAQAVRKHHPGLRILFMSGYAEASSPRGVLRPEENLLLKPFSGHELACKVREVLDTPAD